SVLPAASFIEVQDEDLANDPEGQARRLVAHCGLDWDEQCLSFHETVRPIRTASLVQARKPIYADSIGRSRLYGGAPDPLPDALEGESPRANAGAAGPKQVRAPGEARA